MTASRFILAGTIAAFLSLRATPTWAAGFTLSGNSSSPQTISGTSSNTGTVNAGVVLNIASSSGIPVTMSGGTAGSPSTLINKGTIEVTGTGSARAVQSASTNAILVIQNNSGATIFTINNDAVAAGTSSTTVSSVSLTNAGTIESAAGGQAVNFNKIVNGAANSVTNSGTIKATGSDAVRPGLNGTISNSGTIQSIAVSGSSSDGVDLQTTSNGVVITNASNWSAGSPLTPGTGVIDGGRHGITGGPTTNIAFTTSVTNNLGGTIRGNNGSGINLDGLSSLQTATIVNGGTITGNGHDIGNGVSHDGDGIDVDGLVNVTNTGIIRSINSFNIAADGVAHSEGITVGGTTPGGAIVNSGTIEGLVAAGNTNAIGIGISLLGNDSLTIPGTREAIYGDGIVTNLNGGLIRGDSGSGILVDGPASGHTVTINNAAGATIRGGATLTGLGGASAAILTGEENDTINNAGTIDGSSNGKAIELGAGNNALNITGGSASILGNISGGTGGTHVMTLDPGTGNSFAYAGSISNFSTVEVKSGTVTLTGVSTYTGVTKLTGGQLTLDGANLLNSASTLDLNGGHLKIIANGPNGQTFASLTLEDHSLIDLDPTSLTFLDLGPVSLGKTLTIENYDEPVSPDYAFRFLGDLTSDSDFLTLIGQTTIDGAPAVSHFDGTYTDVAPVPEPSTIGFGIALVGVIGWRRGRRGGARAVGEFRG